MKTHFRPILLFRVISIATLLFISAWFYAAVLVDDLFSKLIIISLVFFLEIFTIERFIAPQWNDTLTIDENGIHGIVRRQKINIQWKDVKSIWQPEAYSVSRSLIISTTRGLVEIFIGHLGRSSIWNALRWFGPQAIFEPGKYRRSYDYIKLQSIADEIFEQIDFPLRSTQYPARIVGWFGLLFFTLLMFISMRYLICFAPFWGLLLLLPIASLLNVGSLEFDLESITYYAWLGRYRIQWDEIQKIEQEPLGGWLLLYGENKRLGIPGPTMWSGKSKEIMVLFFQTRVLEKDFEIMESFRVNFRFWSKNTRISRNN